jgi:hypothetical protein
MRVAPVPDNPEMILIRPEHAEFVFPAGRYAPVLKNVAYDFTLDSPISGTAHCRANRRLKFSDLYQMPKPIEFQVSCKTHGLA